MKTVFLISWLLPLGRFADGAGHKYKKGDRVELWMNKVRYVHEKIDRDAYLAVSSW